MKRNFFNEVITLLEMALKRDLPNDVRNNIAVKLDIIKKEFQFYIEHQRKDKEAIQYLENLKRQLELPSISKDDKIMMSMFFAGVEAAKKEFN